MKRAPLASLLLPLLVLCPGESVRAAVLVFQNGSRLDVREYRIAGELVVLTARDGRLRSVPRESVDLDATRASNVGSSPDSISDSASDPAEEALRLIGLRRTTDELTFAALRAGDELLAAAAHDPRARTLRAAVGEGFDPDRFYRVAEAAFREKSRALAWNEILPWLQSGLVRKLQELSSEEPDPAALEEFRTTLRASPPPLARLELVERLDRASGTSATAVVMELSLLRALLAGVNESADSRARLSPRQIEELVALSRPERSAAARERIRVLLLYRYRSVADTDLRQYLGFLESRGGWSLGRSVLESLFVAMEDAARRAGELFGARLRDAVKAKV